MPILDFAQDAPVVEKDDLLTLLRVSRQDLLKILVRIDALLPPEPARNCKQSLETPGE